MIKKKKILNAKELRCELGISNTRFYQFLDNGMPYHQIGQGRKYYILEEVYEWLTKVGFHQKTTWIQ